MENVRFLIYDHKNKEPIYSAMRPGYGFTLFEIAAGLFPKELLKFDADDEAIGWCKDIEIILIQDDYPLRGIKP